MRAHTHGRYSDTDGPKGATIGGSGGRKKRQCLDHGTTHGPKSFWLGSARAAKCWSSQSTPSLFSEATSPKKRTIACRQVAQSPFPAPCLSPDPEFAPDLRSPRKGVLGTGGFSSSVTTPLPRLSLVSWLKLFLEAAPGALGLTSSILRHSKRVFWGEWKREVLSVRVRRSQEYMHAIFVL